ncbi:MAG: hypothetical protein AAF366_22530 [Pseudomonadota bacterium]
MLPALALLAGDAAAEQPPEVELKAVLDGLRAPYDLPGANAAVVLPDRNVIIGVIGLGDVEADGALAQSERVAHHFRDRCWFSRLPDQTDMMIGHLLQHTEGLLDHVHDPVVQAEMAIRLGQVTGAMKTEAAIAFAFDHLPSFPAGQGWSYSDTGHFPPRLVIEKGPGPPREEPLPWLRRSRSVPDRSCSRLDRRLRYT